MIALPITLTAIGCTTTPGGSISPLDSPLAPPKKIVQIKPGGGAVDIIGRYRNEGFSMAPALDAGEYVFTDNLAYATTQPQRGDIIRFNRSSGPQLIKRVVGLPGETIEIREGKVWIDGRALDEPYVKQPMSYATPARQIEPDHYFVLGDNRNNSADSHVWGAISINDIIGRVTFVYYPFTHMRVISRPTYAPTK